MKKTYEVKFLYKNNRDDFYNDRLDFETEEEARVFIEKLKKDKNIEKISYIYLTITEKVI